MGWNGMGLDGYIGALQLYGLGLLDVLELCSFVA